MEWVVKNHKIKCEVDEVQEKGVGLIRDRGNVRGIIKKFLSYIQVGAYALSENHNLKKGDKVILIERIIIKKEL